MKVEVTGHEEAMAAVKAADGAMGDKAALHNRIARGAAPVMRNHLLDRNASAKRKAGWPRSGYWGHAAESTEGTADAGAATVTVRKEGVGLHLRGGTVRSKRPGGKLAIPLLAQFAGVNPREAWPDRKGAFVVNSGVNAFLAVREGGELKLCYLLLSSVTLDPDPSVLPPEGRMEEAARDACLSFLRKAEKAV